jgi:hypothetical protein
MCLSVAGQEIFLSSAIFGTWVANEYDNIQLMCTSMPKGSIEYRHS